MSPIEDLEVSVEEYDVFLPHEVWGEVDASCVLEKGAEEKQPQAIPPLFHCLGDMKKKPSPLKVRQYE